MLFLFTALPASSQQKQLLLLKRGKLIARFNPGDDIRFKKIDNEQIINSYVNNLYVDAVLVHYDTVSFHKIEKIYTAGKPLSPFASAFLLKAGVAMFLAVSVNDAVFRDEGIDMGSPINITAFSAMGLGIFLRTIKKKSYKPGRRFHLLVVDSTSPLYRKPE